MDERTYARPPPGRRGGRPAAGDPSRRPARTVSTLLYVSTVAAVALVGWLGAAPAHAANPVPVVSISSLVIKPMPSGDPNDASHDVIQTVAWSNLPQGAELWFQVPQTLGLVWHDDPYEWVCGGGGGCFWAPANVRPHPAKFATPTDPVSWPTRTRTVPVPTRSGWCLGSRATTTAARGLAR